MATLSSKSCSMNATKALKALCLLILGAVMVTAEDKPQANVHRSQLKEIGGKVLIDAQAEVTQPFQIDHYINFVNVSTPSLTPATGHALLFSNSGANQFIAKFSDGTTQVLGGSSGGAGTITGVTAGTDLTGGGTTGTVTLNVDNTLVLETSSATATYLQKSSATATYLNSTVAANTYLTQSSATATYLQQSSATVTYPILVGGKIQNSQIDKSSITAQGNTFNGASQLLQLNSSTQLPAVSGVNLTNLNASNLASGTVPDGQLSANVDLLNTAETVTSSRTFNGQVNISSTVRLSGSAGNAGQVLASGGSTAVPTWTTVSGSTGTSLTTYTPTISGFGTTSNLTAKYLQSGNSVMVWVTFQAGTTAASAASVTLPVNINSGLSSTTAVLGMGSQSRSELLDSNNDTALVFYDGSTAGTVFFATSGTTGSGYAKANGSTICGNTNYFSFYALYPQ